MHEDRSLQHSLLPAYWSALPVSTQSCTNPQLRYRHSCLAPALHKHTLFSSTTCNRTEHVLTTVFTLLSSASAGQPRITRQAASP